MDTETTGLSGGAGTCPFLIGTGYFEGENYHSRQFFLQEFSGEEGMLKAFLELVSEKKFLYLVTYNGKNFDLPIMENRFVLNRLRHSLGDLGHLESSLSRPAGFIGAFLKTAVW